MTYAEFQARYALALNPQQAAAVQATDGPVLLLAVPGSGKTTTLVARLGYMVLAKQIPPERILTMTYTVSATGDMRSRFAAQFGQALANRMEFRTINGVSARIIQHYQRRLGRKAFSLVTDERELTALVGELYRRQTQEFATESTIKTIRQWITYIKNMQLTGEETDGLVVNAIHIGPLYRAYCQVLRQRRKMDYDDQMVYAYRILRQYPEILADVQRRYWYFCVDEAQDTSKIQHALIALLASARENLFMVGDEDQSIYGFRAAYPQALLAFDQVHPGAKILLLEQNYRSTPQIVSAANRFICGNRNRRPKTMRAVCDPGPEIRAITVKDRRAQYAYLEKVAGNCNRETAVLYRNNDSALPLIDLMSRAGIRYRCRQFDSAFFTHRVVRDVCDIIRLAEHPSDRTLFLNLYYKLGAGISKAAAEAAAGQSGSIWDTLAESEALPARVRGRCKALKTHLNHLRNDPGDRAVYRIVHYMGYGDYLESKEMDVGKIPILEAIGAREPTPQGLLRRLEELSAIVQTGSGQAEESRFILSTIHSSKGLEYDRVFLMDVADGIFPACLPSAGGGEAEAYAEERRLFYVGMTRAKQELAVFRFQSPALHSTFAEELFPTAKPVKAKAPENRNIPGVSIVSHRRTPAPGEEWRAGGLVEHRLFGRGKIVSRQGDIVSIRFANGKVRYLALNFAVESRQLKRVNPNE